MRKCIVCDKDLMKDGIYCSDDCFTAHENQRLEQLKGIANLIPPTMETILENPEAPLAMPYPAAMQHDYQLTEIEVQKLNLQPGDTLMVTIKNDHIDHDSMNSLRAQFKKVFPNNQVFVFGMDSDGDVKLAVVSQPEPQYTTDELKKP
jgi:hypothetical protein